MWVHSAIASDLQGDANDDNTIVSPDASQVVCFIDFGDASPGYIVCEVAIAMAYAMMIKQQNQPLERGAAVLKGFLQTMPLSKEELKLIPYLIETRIAVSVTMSNHAQLINPNNKHAAVSLL